MIFYRICLTRGRWSRDPVGSDDVQGADIVEKGGRELHLVGSGGVYCLRRMITVQVGNSRFFHKWHHKKYENAQ